MKAKNKKFILFISILFFICFVMTAIYLLYYPCIHLSICHATPLHHDPIKQEISIGAYYQTSLQNPNATRVVLSLFRRVYPEAPLYVYNEH